MTTDPARDDEKTIRTCLDRFNKSFPIGLTGDLDTVIEVGDPLHVYVSDGKKPPTGGYDLGGHSTFTLALDSDDEAVAPRKPGDVSQGVRDRHPHPAHRRPTETAETRTPCSQLITASIPQPGQRRGTGPFLVRGYALCIILGIIVAIWIGEKRWQARAAPWRGPGRRPVGGPVRARDGRPAYPRRHRLEEALRLRR